MSISGSGTTDVLVIGNFIGTNSTGAHLGNLVGVLIAASGNVVGQAGAGNTIGFNTQFGVSVLSGNDNVISQNDYTGTNGPAPTVPANDIGISPTGNNDQLAPSILNAALNGSNLRLQLTLAVPGGTTGTTTVTFEVYQDLSPTGIVERQFVGTLISVPYSSSNNYDVEIPLSTALSNPAVILATATASNNGTSSFSDEVTIGNPYVVVNNANSGFGSLNAVIQFADAHQNPDPSDHTTHITFAIPKGSHVIDITSPLPPVTVPVTLDGTSQPGIVINGGGNDFDGLVLGSNTNPESPTSSQGSTIKGLDIVDFGMAGIHVETDFDTITDNTIGANSTGTAAGPGNHVGIWVDNSVGITIGGLTAGSGNAINFNTAAGISISATTAASATNTLVVGNTIFRNFEGIEISSSGNTIGATNGGSVGGSVGVIQQLGMGANIISGNTGDGVLIGNSSNSGQTYIGNVVAGNQIIFNSQNGVEVSQDFSEVDAATIEYNFIGIENGSSVSQNNVPTGNGLSGVLLDETDTANTLSGAAAIVMGNVISANGLSGVTTESGVPNDDTDSVQGAVLSASIFGNIIGLDKTGEFAVAPATESGTTGIVLPIGNALDGILIDNVVGVTIGAATSNSGLLSSGGAPPSTPSNLISGNLGRGIEIRGNLFSSLLAASNVIEGNFIGTDISGTLAVNVPVNGSPGQTYTLGNLSDGVFLFLPANTAINNNLISDNRAAGIHATRQSGSITSAATLTISQNYIGTDVSGTSVTDANDSTVHIGNGSDGVFLDDIGSSMSATSVTENVISGNRANGIDLLGSTFVSIIGNDIGTDKSGTLTGLGNSSNGIFLNLSDGNQIGSNSGARNIISGNLGSGILISGTSLDLSKPTTLPNNTVENNYIGTDSTGTVPIANHIAGIIISDSSNNLISENVVSANVLDGIILANVATFNTIDNNKNGTDTTGTAPLGNTADGVFLLGAPALGINIGAPGQTLFVIKGNSITNNIISGNAANGVQIFGSGSITNTVSDNTIGLGKGGETIVPNGGNGVYLNDAGDYSITDAIILGPTNVISGNCLSVVLIFGTGNDGGYNIVKGNRIGTDFSGMLASYTGPNQSQISFGNGGNGIFIYGTSGNVIGGTLGSSSLNLISNNAQAGIAIFSPATSAIATANIVVGNWIGTSADGNTATDPNQHALGNKGDGIDIYSGTRNTIGGAAGGINVISGNLGNGVLIAKLSGVDASLNVLDGNYIGTNSTGNGAIPNVQNGVLVENASGNTIGGISAAAASGPIVPRIPSNVISANRAYGVQFLGVSQGNTVEGDFIGVNSQGTGTLGNSLAGVFVNNLGTSSSNETIGGTTPGAGNIISGSTAGYGVEILGPALTGTSGSNVVEGNEVGIDINGKPIANGNGVFVQSIGVFIQNSAGNMIGGGSGGPSDSAKNVISGNSQAGVQISGLYSTGNEIQGNYIGTDLKGNGRPGIAALTSQDPNTLQTIGVSINTPSPSNTFSGANNVISDNVISGNLVGVNIAGQGSGTAGSGTVQGVPIGQNLVVGNKIGTDWTGMAPDPNFEYGVYIDNSSANSIGGTGNGQGNLISANGIDGIEIFGGITQISPQRSKTKSAAAGNVIVGNKIGVDVNDGHTFTNGNASVQTPDGPQVTLGEQLYGVVIIGSSGNTIGGGAPGSQLIGGNMSVGVYITRQDFGGNIFSIPTNNIVAFNRIIDNGQYGVFRFEAQNNPVALAPGRSANHFSGNPIKIEDFIQSINKNNTLPNPKSKFAHPKHPKATAVKRVPRAKVHVVTPKRTSKPAKPAAARPKVPALFHAGKKTIVVAHVPAHPHR